MGLSTYRARAFSTRALSTRAWIFENQIQEQFQVYKTPGQSDVHADRSDGPESFAAATCFLKAVCVCAVCFQN